MIRIDFNIIFDYEDPNEDIPFEYDDTIYGDIILKVNNSVYEYEESVLDYWIGGFLKAVSHFECNSEYFTDEHENSRDHIKSKPEKSEISVKYVTCDNVVWTKEVEYAEYFEYFIDEPENNWDRIKFEREKSEILITYLSHNNAVWTEKVEYSDFKTEVIRAAREFIDWLCDFDFAFNDSTVVLAVKKLLDQITDYSKRH